MRRLKRSLLYVTIAFVLAITLFPIFWMLNTAFKPRAEVLASVPVWLPREPTLRNFSDVITGTGMAQGGLANFYNSLVASSASMALALLIGTPAAYGLARFKFKRNKDLAMWILSTRMLPPAATIIPVYLMIRTLGLIDTLPALIIVYTVYNLPFVTWMMRGFFINVPEEIEESAKIDGCSDFQAFYKISVPLVKAGLVVSALFAFVFVWNEFIYALVLTRINAQTIPIQIASYAGVKGVEWGKMMALSTISSLPGIVLAIFLQRNLVSGLTMGAVKE